MNYGLPQTEIAKPCLLQLFFSLTVQGGAVPNAMSVYCLKLNILCH